MDGRLQIFTGNSNIPLARSIAAHLNLNLGRALVGVFKNGETRVQLEENVRGSDVFVLQTLTTPVDHHLMELLMMIDALRRASAQRVTAVIPYYGYAKQEKKTTGREPITAKLVANLIATAGAHRVLTMDLHAPAIEGFFDIPVDHLYAAPVFVDYFQHNPIENLIVVAPDTGGAERARAYAKRLNAGLALVDKRREKANVAEVMNVVGDVRGKNCLIVDDMCDTGGTICKVAGALHGSGANEIYACFSHAVFSGGAIENIARSHIKKVIVTNSIPLCDKGELLREQGRIEVLNVGKLLASAIKSIHDETSVSSLFI